MVQTKHTASSRIKILLCQALIQNQINLKKCGMCMTKTWETIISIATKMATTIITATGTKITSIIKMFDQLETTKLRNFGITLLRKKNKDQRDQNQNMA